MHVSVYARMCVRVCVCVCACVCLRVLIPLNTQSPAFVEAMLV